MPQPVLITVAQAAEIISSSRSVIYRMWQAREYGAKIAAGLKTAADVPSDVRQYLGVGFPPRVKIGSLTRVEKAAVELWLKAWIATQCTTPCTTVLEIAISPRDSGLITL